MATAREVIETAIRDFRVARDPGLANYAEGLLAFIYAGEADAALAALDAQGLCVVSKEDVENAVSVLRKVIAHADNMGGLSLMQPEVDAADRLDAALAAGGAQ